ncbi:hypothetical protein JCM8547_005645 [Rhodosporidiobolus lusitaniae]
MISTSGLIASLCGWLSTAFGISIFAPEILSTVRGKPWELSRDTFIFFILWLIGDGAQLAGLLVGGSYQITQIVLNIAIAVLETLMLILLLYYAGHIPCLPTPQSYTLASHAAHLAREGSHIRALGTTTLRFLSRDGEGVKFGYWTVDSAGPPGTAPGAEEMEEMRREREARESMERGERPKDWGKVVVSTWRKIEGPVILVLTTLVGLSFWIGLKLLGRNEEEDEPVSSIPDTMEEWLGWGLLVLGLVCWVLPRCLNASRSIKDKRPEGITKYSIITMGGAHMFNILSVLIVNHTGPSFIGQAPYILNSVFCLILDILRFYLKHVYSHAPQRGVRTTPWGDSYAAQQRLNGYRDGKDQKKRSKKGKGGMSWKETQQWLAEQKRKKGHEHLSSSSDEGEQHNHDGQSSDDALFPLPRRSHPSSSTRPLHSRSHSVSSEVSSVAFSDLSDSDMAAHQTSSRLAHIEFLRSSFNARRPSALRAERAFLRSAQKYDAATVRKSASARRQAAQLEGEEEKDDEAMKEIWKEVWREKDEKRHARLMEAYRELEAEEQPLKEVRRERRELFPTSAGRAAGRAATRGLEGRGGGPNLTLYDPAASGRV